jgi:hypothetical protein
VDALSTGATSRYWIGMVRVLPAPTVKFRSMKILLSLIVGLHVTEQTSRFEILRSFELHCQIQNQSPPASESCVPLGSRYYVIPKGDVRTMYFFRTL